MDNFILPEDIIYDGKPIGKYDFNLTIFFAELLDNKRKKLSDAKKIANTIRKYSDFLTLSGSVVTATQIVNWRNSGIFIKQNDLRSVCVIGHTSDNLRTYKGDFHKKAIALDHKQLRDLLFDSYCHKHGINKDFYKL